MKFFIRFFGFFFFATIASFQLQAVQRPQWELGIGVGSALFPHYLGSNHIYRFTLPFPTVVYRSDVFELARDTRLFLIDSDFFAIEFALGGRAPVESADVDDKAPKGVDNPHVEIDQTKNYTRRGMSDLPLALFLGLQLEFNFTDHLTLEIPVVNGFTVSHEASHVGNYFSPTLEYDFFGRDSESSFSISIESFNADENYNEFYYEVEDDDVLEGRPAFAPDPGEVAIDISIGGVIQISDQWSIAGGYAFHDMRQSIVKDSPLVIAPTSRSVGLSISYRFLQSSTKVDVKK